MIRKATIKDIPEIIKIYSNVKEIEDFTGMKHDRNYFKSYINRNARYLIVCEMNGVIAGAMNIEIEKGVYVFLNNIVVSKKYKGLGAGRQLMNALKDIAKKNKTKYIVLLVFEWNKNMRKIVEHYGYKSGKRMMLYHKKI